MIRFIALACILLASQAAAFVVPLTMEQKCSKSDVIVRGVVIKMVHLSMKLEDSQGQGYENLLGQEYGGPYSVALVRVTDVLKGDPKKLQPIILVPCGYNIDESPAELTDTKEYVLFLESMGHNYFHPLGAYCMHRVELNRVSKSGFDTDFDFDPKKKDAETLSYADFAAQIRKLTQKPKPKPKPKADE